MKLTTGGGTIPLPWGYPSPVYVRGFLGIRRKKVGGFVWNGVDPATPADIARLLEWNPDAQTDPGTLVGRGDPEYSTYAERNHETQRIVLR